MAFGFQNSDFALVTPRPLRAQTIRTPQSPIRSGLTLIELLVVIVILTTLVGGVIPVLSPNNDTRKIRAASRGLQGYITLTQAKAARTGRPHGIAFRETSPESGAAIEVFGLQVPPPFGGFSTESRAVIALAPPSALGQPAIYNPGYRTNFLYHPRFNEFPLYTVTFVLADNSLTADFLPPRTFRVGDEIDIDGNLFVIVDSPSNQAKLEIVGDEPNQVAYFGTAVSPVNVLECVWANSSGQVQPRGLKRYRINRQPANSTESPYQLPASIAIDMQASVAEGSDQTILNYPRFPMDSSFYTDRSTIPAGDPVPIDSVGIMFSPTGAVDRLLLNGKETTNIARIVLMLGRIENTGIDPDPANTPRPWIFNNVNDKQELENKQEVINWLNTDSRLLSIVPSNGRVVVSEPAFVDPSLLADPDDAGDQLETAHGFAHEMTTVGGN